MLMRAQDRHERGHYPHSKVDLNLRVRALPRYTSPYRLQKDTQFVPFGDLGRRTCEDGTIVWHQENSK
jgi:hypothetical protein